MAQSEISEHRTVTDEHLRAIRRIIVRWGLTERLLMDLVWEVATGQ